MAQSQAVTLKDTQIATEGVLVVLALQEVCAVTSAPWYS